MNKKIHNIIARDEQYQNKCVEKWKAVLDAKAVAPIKDAHTYRTTAVLLENQSRVLKEAAANTSSVWGSANAYGGAVGNGDNYAPGDNRLPKTILPMIRRTMPELIANETVGVQPMSVPVSLAFAIRFRYDRGPLHQANSAGSLTAATSTSSVGFTPGHEMTQLPATVGDGTTEGAEMGYNYLDTTFTGRKNYGFTRVINPSTGIPFTDAEARDYVNAAASKTFSTWEEVIAAAATDTDVKDAVADISIAGGKFSFSEQDLGTAALLGDYEATGRIPKAKFTFEKKSVEAGTRRIGTSWTLELEQDIRNMNGIDVETEITSMMSYELQAEIDREMIVRMLYAALSANEYTYWDGTKADARWMGERDRVFYQHILQQSNRMAIRNRRGPANFIIATPDVCTLLEALPQYALMEVNGNINTAASGVAKIGTIGNGRFTVYRDSRTPVQNNNWINNGWDHQGKYTPGKGIPDFALLGYKGAEYWDAGIIFCPYIPIMLQRVIDPVSMEPNVGLMTRYGVVDNLFGSHLYYHVVLIDTLTNTRPAGNDDYGIANTFPTGQTVTIKELTIGDKGYKLVEPQTSIVDDASTTVGPQAVTAE